MSNNVFTKDPDAVLDFKFDFAPLTNDVPNAESDYLVKDETISSITITAATGITVDSSSITDDATSATVWLSGGTAGTTYSVNCEIVTSDSRTDQRTAYIKVRER